MLAAAVHCAGRRDQSRLAHSRANPTKDTRRDAQLPLRVPSRRSRCRHRDQEVSATSQHDYAAQGARRRDQDRYTETGHYTSSRTTPRSTTSASASMHESLRGSSRWGANTRIALRGGSVHEIFEYDADGNLLRRRILRLPTSPATRSTCHR